MFIRFLKLFLPPVDDLGIPDQPRKRPKELPAAATSTPNPVDHGKEWVYTKEGDEQTPHVHTWDAVDSDKGKTVVDRKKTLTGWDHVCLDEKFEGTKNGWDATVARVCKDLWSTGMSSQAITDSKTANGLTQDGYSVRNVKKYTAAFYRALECEQGEAHSKGQDSK